MLIPARTGEPRKVHEFPQRLDFDPISLIKSPIASVLEYEIPDAGDTTLRVQLLDELLGAAWSKDESGEWRVPAEWQWVLHTIAKLLTSVLDDVPEGGTRPRSVGTALELFQWEEQANREALAGELADVGLYLLQLAYLTGIDLGQAIHDKLAVNYKRSWAKDDG